MTDSLCPGKASVLRRTNIHSMSSCRNSDESSTFSWKWTSAQVIRCSASSQQLLICSTKPSWLQSRDHFLIRNVKCHLCGTWFIVNESLKIAVTAWSESQERKFYLHGIKQLTTKVENMHRCCMRICQKRRHVWHNMLTFYSQVAKLFDHPS